MRFEKLTTVLRLARELAGSGEGMTLDDMAREAGVNRRTAERMRDVLRDLFPTFDEIRDGPVKRFRISGGLDSFLQAPSVDELAELQAAIRALEASGGDARAALLQSLSHKIHAALRASDRRKIAPDLDALKYAEEMVLQAGPRPLADAETLATLRAALKAVCVCAFKYASGTGRSARARRVRPYGLLYGKAYYLVGPEVGKAAPVLWRLDRISSLELEEPTTVPADFDLADFAARSFGAFQETPETIVLRFSPDAAPDARRFLFHPTQQLEDQDDGSLVVTFTAGGLLELVRHLFTWGNSVEILAPERLKAIMLRELQALLPIYEETQRA